MAVPVYMRLYGSSWLDPYKEFSFMLEDNNSLDGCSVSKPF